MNNMQPVKTAISQDSKTWGLILHLAQLGNYIVPFSGFIAPIVIWQLKKEEVGGIDEHGRNVVNWMLSMLIYGLVCGILCFVFIGFILGPALVVINIIYAVMGAIKANDGVIWKYPGTISFI